jgi:hypothetical protein
MILLGVLALWSFGGLLVTRLVIDINGHPSLPAPNFFRADRDVSSTSAQVPADRPSWSCSLARKRRWSRSISSVIRSSGTSGPAILRSKGSSPI